MPYNPLTGQYDNYEDSFNTIGGIGAGVMNAMNTESGLAMRMLEHAPGITSLMGYGIYRGSNTMMRGGFGGRGAAPGASQFMGSSARQQRALAAGKSPMLKGFMSNYMSPRPGMLGRLSHLGVFQSYGTGAYSPFRMGEALNKSAKAKDFFARRGVDTTTGNVFGPGLMSAVSAGRRVDKLEQKAISGSKRAARKVQKVRENAQAIARMNNVSMANVGSIIGPDRRMIPGSLTSGSTGNMLASSLGGSGTQFMAGAFRASMGLGVADLTGNALLGHQRVQQKVAASLGSSGITGRGGTLYQTADDAAKILQQGFMKTLGSKGTASLVSQGGAKMAGILAMKGIGLALPGVQLVAAASLAYDLGKMGGEIVKNGINLVRDANISMQGSLAKPIFGMGYRDTEAAATSRARGVMAIQNSRLNARSALGGEAAMMAAHYG
jgi:hypothetical protein